MLIYYIWYKNQVVYTIGLIEVTTMLNAICVILLAVIIGVIIFVVRNAVEYRMHDKIFTYTNLALLNTAYYTLFTVRTILFYNLVIPEDMLEKLINFSPKIQKTIDIISDVASVEFLSEAMFWVFALFFVAAAFTRGLTGYKSIRLGYIVSYCFLIYSLQFLGINKELINRYDTLTTIAIALWIISIMAVKIQTVISISKKQKMQAAENKANNPIKDSEPPLQPM